MIQKCWSDWELGDGNYRTKRFINNGSCQNSLGEEHRLGITILSQSNLRFKKKIILVYMIVHLYCIIKASCYKKQLKILLDLYYKDVFLAHSITIV